MIVIADSGSTKTVWSLVKDGKVILSALTQGMNPYFTPAERMHEIIRTELAGSLPSKGVDEVFFYGAGCSTENNNRLVAEAVNTYMTQARVSVFHDILGAARALFGRGTGIACILGTGCNSCYYDGTDIYSKIPSLGYLFGDEGAGSYLGKLFFRDYFGGTLPEKIRRAFDVQFHYSLEDILNALYNKPFPNRFLASVSLFLHPMKEHPYVHDLVLGSFTDFLNAHIRKYEGYGQERLGFIGSIAHHYIGILSEAMLNEGLAIHRVLPSPMEGLLEYHISR
jgi:glucosamine kinase